VRDIPESWRPYARLQRSLSNRNRLDEQTWGLEAGLDHFLEIQALSLPASDQDASIERAIANGRARERHRLCLRNRFLVIAEAVDPEPMLRDRERLNRLFARLDTTERKILYATAFGYNSAEISGASAIKPATVRKRIDRLRRRLAA
jgi:DNA-directed RNA polymerase specialized sigma24 family protein